MKVNIYRIDYCVGKFNPSSRKVAGADVEDAIKLLKTLPGVCVTQVMEVVRLESNVEVWGA